MDYIQIIELVAAALGVLYLVLEVKASMWLWRVGVLLPLFYIYISWQSKVYCQSLLPHYLHLGLVALGKAGKNYGRRRGN